MGQGTQAFLRALVLATPVGTVPAATVETEREVDPTLPSPFCMCVLGLFRPVRCVLLRLSVGGGDRYGAFPTFGITEQDR